MSDKNTEAYQSLGWILDYSDDGLFFVIASERMQQEIVEHYDSSNIAIYDYKQHSGTYSFNKIEEWKHSNPNSKAYFILNFQFAIREEKDIMQFNFSRDMLENLQANFIFCMTQKSDDILAKNAYDIYSYVKFRLFFEDEVINLEEESNITMPDKSIGFDSEIKPNMEQSKTQLLSEAISLIHRAKQLSNEYRYYDSLSCLQEALMIREKFFGKNHIETAHVYHQLGKVYTELDDHTKALEWYHKSLAISEKLLRKEHPNIATTYNNIGTVCDRQGEYNKALEWYHKALAISEGVFGKDHPDTGNIYNNIGLVCNNQGKYDKALEWYYKSLTISENIFGKEHPDTVMIYNNIGIVYSNQGEYDKALEWYHKALAIREKVSGKEHIHTAKIYNNIGVAYNKQGEYDKALEWYHKALAISEKILGKEQHNTKKIYKNIRTLYDHQSEE